MKVITNIILLFILIINTGMTVANDNVDNKNKRSKKVMSTDTVDITDTMQYVVVQDLGQMKTSWYGKEEHGGPTASGERYNMYAYTAANKKLPFNTLLLVTHRKTQKSVIVRVNDRGPYIKGRSLDVSFVAAKKLGIIGKGVDTFDVKIIKKSPLIDYELIAENDTSAVIIPKN